MTKILHIISDANIGGAGRSLLNYLACCDRERFAVSVVLPRGSALKPAVEKLGIPVREIDAMADRSMDPKAIAPLRRVIRAEAPDLVHTHGAMAGRIAARLCGKKVIYTKHCAFPPTGLRASVPARLAARLTDALLSDGVIAIGPSAKEILLQEGIPAHKITQLLNGVAPLREPTPQERARQRAQYGFTPQDFVVGMLARIEPYKGQSLLFDAAEQLWREGRRVKLFVVGDGSDRERLLRRAADLPEGSVVLPGFLSDVEKALWCMDVQVNASTQSETSSLSLLEGMSLRCPAVVSDVGGNPFLVEQGKNGFVFPNRDAAALARCLARLMDEPALYDAMQKQSAQIFARRFTAEIYAKNIETVYDAIGKGNSRA